MEDEQGFFDFAAYVGMTKHLGGLRATDDLAALCGIDEGSCVLDVGCGAGATPCYIARKYACCVVGVDIKKEMIERCRERASREKVTEKVSFRVADAQDLPFDDDLFDAVITESVTAFPEDKRKAATEYVRVTRPGGYVGLNEATWLKYPPPPEMEAWASQDLGASVKPLTSEGWITLLQHAGLQEIKMAMAPITVSEEAKGIVGRYGYTGMARVLWRTLSLYLRSADYRRFVKRVRGEGITPGNLDEYLGYGLYVGRKPRQDAIDDSQGHEHSAWRMASARRRPVSNCRYRTSSTSDKSQIGSGPSQATLSRRFLLWKMH
jgi:arsenite methyltransferase